MRKVTTPSPTAVARVPPSAEIGGDPTPVPVVSSAVAAARSRRAEYLVRLAAETEASGLGASVAPAADVIVLDDEDLIPPPAPAGRTKTTKTDKTRPMKRKHSGTASAARGPPLLAQQEARSCATLTDEGLAGSPRETPSPEKKQKKKPKTDRTASATRGPPLAQQDTLSCATLADEGLAGSPHEVPSPEKEEKKKLKMDWGVHSKKSPFPYKLHALVNNASGLGYDDIVSWTDAGETFTVHDHQRFCVEVLPAYFGHGTLRSFLRQLSYWGFYRVSALDVHHTSAGGLAYCHPHFASGGRDDLGQIRRQAKGGGRWTFADGAVCKKFGPAIVVPARVGKARDANGAPSKTRRKTKARSSDVAVGDESPQGVGAGFSSSDLIIPAGLGVVLFKNRGKKRVPIQAIPADDGSCCLHGMETPCTPPRSDGRQRYGIDASTEELSDTEMASLMDDTDGNTVLEAPPACDSITIKQVEDSDLLMSEASDDSDDGDFVDGDGTLERSIVPPRMVTPCGAERRFMAAAFLDMDDVDDDDDDDSLPLVVGRDCHRVSSGLRRVSGMEDTEVEPSVLALLLPDDEFDDDSVIEGRVTDGHGKSDQPPPQEDNGAGERRWPIAHELEDNSVTSLTGLLASPESFLLENAMMEDENSSCVFESDPSSDDDMSITSDGHDLQHPPPRVVDIFHGRVFHLVESDSFEIDQKDTLFPFQTHMTSETFSLSEPTDNRSFEENTIINTMDDDALPRTREIVTSLDGLDNVDKTSGGGEQSWDSNFSHLVPHEYQPDAILFPDTIYTPLSTDGLDNGDVPRCDEDVLSTIHVASVRDDFDDDVAAAQAAV